MTNVLQEKLDTISEYWISIERDLTEDSVVLNVGFPLKWDIRDNDVIGYEITRETKVGRVIKVKPKNKNITLDDLVKFVEVVIYLNTEIAKKEDEFAKMMEGKKESMKKEVDSFYENFDKEKSKMFNEFSNVEKPTPKRRTKKQVEQPTTTE